MTDVTVPGGDSLCSIALPMGLGPAMGKRAKDPQLEGDEQLRLVTPPAGWTPPDAAGRAIIRVMLAVKARRDAAAEDAA